MVEWGAVTVTAKVAEFINKGKPRSFAVYNQTDKIIYFSVCYVEEDLSIGWMKVPARSHFAFEHNVPLIGYYFRIYSRTASGKKEWHNNDKAFGVAVPDWKLTGRETFRMRRCFDDRPHLIEGTGVRRMPGVPSRQLYLTGDYTYTVT